MFNLEVQVSNQLLISIGGGVFLLLVGWVLKAITDSIAKVSAESARIDTKLDHEIKLLAAQIDTIDDGHRKTREEYVPKSEYRLELAKIDGRFDKMDVKLDRIIDKLDSARHTTV